jgi:hypothetical protein
MVEGGGVSKLGRGDFRGGRGRAGRAPAGPGGGGFSEHSKRATHRHVSQIGLQVVRSVLQLAGEINTGQHVYA